MRNDTKFWKDPPKEVILCRKKIQRFESSFDEWTYYLRKFPLQFHIALVPGGVNTLIKLAGTDVIYYTAQHPAQSADPKYIVNAIRQLEDEAALLIEEMMEMRVDKDDPHARIPPTPSINK